MYTCLFNIKMVKSFLLHWHVDMFTDIPLFPPLLSAHGRIKTRQKASAGERSHSRGP